MRILIELYTLFELTIAIFCVDRNAPQTRLPGKQIDRGNAIAVPWMYRLNPTFRANGTNGAAIDIPHDPLDDVPDPFTPDEADKLSEMLGEDYICPISTFVRF